MSKCNGDCNNCDELVALGDGDHMCGITEKMVVSDYAPTENFGGAKNEQ